MALLRYCGPLMDPMNLLEVSLGDRKEEIPQFEELFLPEMTEKRSDRHGQISRTFAELQAGNRLFEFSDRLSFEFERREEDMIVMLNMLYDKSPRCPVNQKKLSQ